MPECRGQQYGVFIFSECQLIFYLWYIKVKTRTRGGFYSLVILFLSDSNVFRSMPRPGYLENNASDFNMPPTYRTWEKIAMDDELEQKSIMLIRKHD